MHLLVLAFMCLEFCFLPESQRERWGAGEPSARWLLTFSSWDKGSNVTWKQVLFPGDTGGSLLPTHPACYEWGMPGWASGPRQWQGHLCPTGPWQAPPTSAALLSYYGKHPGNLSSEATETPSFQRERTLLSTGWLLQLPSLLLHHQVQESSRLPPCLIFSVWSKSISNKALESVLCKGDLRSKTWEST